MDYEKELPVPIWFQQLEDRLQINKKKLLAHEIGAGSPCVVCKDSCPGLDLHYWRNTCKNCKCIKEKHDFEEDDGLRFHMLFENEGDIRTRSSCLEEDKLVLDMKITDNNCRNAASENGLTKTKIKFDWVPSVFSPSMSVAYMKELPPEKMPVSGTEGAENRKFQLKKQIPIHDIMPKSRELFGKDESNNYYNYLEKIRQNSGIGQVFQVKVNLMEMCQDKNNQTVSDISGQLRNINIHPNHPICPSPGFPALQSHMSGNPSSANSNSYYNPADGQRCLKPSVSDLKNANQPDFPHPFFDPTTTVLYYVVSKNIQCQECQYLIEDKSVAVFIGKTSASGLAWHPKCFVCCVCKELLVDLVHVYDSKSKSVYCGRHYPKALKIHRCFACDELILVQKFVFADDNYYHLNHFCCVSCDKELGGEEYLLNELNNDLPTCLPCYEGKFAKRCGTCGEPIGVNDKSVLYNGTHWHPNCFKCAAPTCHKPLAGKLFLLVNNSPYCSKECRPNSNS